VVFMLPSFCPQWDQHVPEVTLRESFRAHN
jgi:hypothetical protein